MGDVLGKECGDGEKEEIVQEQEPNEDDVREEADGAPSGDEKSSQSSGEADCLEFKEAEDAKVRFRTPDMSVWNYIPVVHNVCCSLS